MSIVDEAIAYYSVEPNHFNECRIMRELVEQLEQCQKERDEAVELLKDATEFIANGVEFGYITMPDKETPDSAHDTLPNIEAFLNKLERIR